MHGPRSVGPMSGDHRESIRLVPAERARAYRPVEHCRVIRQELEPVRGIPWVDGVHEIETNDAPDPLERVQRFR
jgi:hypothetical protein